MSLETTIRSDTAERHRKKYLSKNPVQRYVLNRLFDRIAALLRSDPPDSVLDVGCGEGFFLREMRARGALVGRYTGIDLRPDALSEAAALHPGETFLNVDLLDWDQAPRSFDLIIASQVLEHLPNPEPMLRQICRLAKRSVLVTVPLEPYFQLMNLLRGRDLCRLGNHPEHVQRWTFSGIQRTLSPWLVCESAFRVFPFSVVYGKPRGGSGGCAQEGSTG
ncbi:MAG: class I SAM-dependent methyltransferase [Bdellovibrionota bacterium]